MAIFNCPKCGAPVEYDVKDRLVRCRYCSSEIFIDKSGAGFYYILSFAIDEDSVVGIFKRWAGGSTRAKDLDRLAHIVSLKKRYFPVYLFKRDVNGTDQVFVEPAASTTLPGLHSLKVPAGDMVIFDKNFNVGGIEMVIPDIEMTSYLGRLPGKAKEQALVYFPIYVLDYAFEGKNWKVVISATSGEVFAGDFPKRSSAGYMTVATTGFLAFLIEGLLAIWNPMLAGVLIMVTMAGIFLASFWVARRL
ncbi:MAG: zinc ribbon domain-containing protein [Methanomassiliicoccales archaeon]|nr:MAG: zinc ribbon domain-containing protein [Methanomassiliicoccales archaeon]